MSIQKLAMLSVHTSPLAKLGDDKVGGMNVYVKELAEELARRGITVDIYTRRTSANQPEIAYITGTGVRVIQITAGPTEVTLPDEIYPYLPQFATGILAFVNQQNIQYELIYSHYWLSGWVADRLRDIWGIPYVQMFHTLGQMKNRVAPGHIPAPKPDVRINTELQISRSADRIIAATPAEQYQLQWLYRANRHKIVIVPPGVNIQRFHPVPMEQAKAQLGIPLDTHLLVFVGRIEPLKAIDSILEALHLIKLNRSDLIQKLKFRIVGGNLRRSNAELKRLQALNHDFGLQSVVEFVGAKEQADLPAYYAASLAVLMPSDYESFGMVALEAMACGAPVIASQVGGLAFLVQDHKTGFLIPAREPAFLAQRIIMLLVEPERRQTMGAAAAQLGQAYSWHVVADQLVWIFDKLINRPASRVSRHMN